MPNVVSMADAIQIISSGLARNDSVIAFPAALAIQTWWLGSLPSQIKDWISASRLVGVVAYSRKRPSKVAGAETKAT
jgi:hypothetical protein